MSRPPPVSPSLSASLLTPLGQADHWQGQQPAAFQKTICVWRGSISSLRYVSDYEDTLGLGDISAQFCNRTSRSQEGTSYFLPRAALGRPSRNDKSGVVFTGDFKTEPASECAACAEGPALRLMLCCHRLQILNNFEPGALHVPFALGSANYVTVPTPRRSSQPPWGMLGIDVGDSWAWDLAYCVLQHKGTCIRPLPGSWKGGFGGGEKRQELSPSILWTTHQGTKAQWEFGGWEMGSPARGWGGCAGSELPGQTMSP